MLICLEMVLSSPVQKMFCVNARTLSSGFRDKRNLYIDSASPQDLSPILTMQLLSYSQYRSSPDMQHLR
jgi:hypothetical protein